MERSVEEERAGKELNRRKEMGAGGSSWGGNTGEGEWPEELGGTEKRLRELRRQGWVRETGQGHRPQLL